MIVAAVDISDLVNMATAVTESAPASLLPMPETRLSILPMAASAWLVSAENLILISAMLRPQFRKPLIH